MANYSNFLNSAFRALSEPTRRAVIQRLTTGPAAVRDLARPFEMGLPSFMKHIKVLEDSGLVATSKLRRVRTCRIRSDRLAAAGDWLGALRRLWEDRTERLANDLEDDLVKDGS